MITHTVCDDAAPHEIGRVSLIVKIDQFFPNVDAFTLWFGNECLLVANGKSRAVRIHVSDKIVAE